MSLNSSEIKGAQNSIPFSRIIDNLDALSKSQIANLTLNNHTIEQNINSFIPGKAGSFPLAGTEKNWLHLRYPTKQYKKSSSEFDLYLV